MLTTGQQNLWRRLKYDEVYVYCDGDGLEVEICDQSQTEICTYKLGVATGQGKNYHVFILRGHWARTRHTSNGTVRGFVFFNLSVTPPFEFSAIEIGAPDFDPLAKS
jgi:predicted cupin superfamily sugar epimerase